MARQLKLPMGTVVPSGADVTPTPNARLILVDLERMRASKTYAQVKAQAAAWRDDAVDEYVLGLIAQGGSVMVSRVYRKPSLQQQDRLPVTSYEEAVRRLVCIRADASLPDEAYSTAVQIIADVFWLNDNRVRMDVMVAARELG